MTQDASKSLPADLQVVRTAAVELVRYIRDILNYWHQQTVVHSTLPNHTEFKIHKAIVDIEKLIAVAKSRVEALTNAKAKLGPVQDTLSDLFKCVGHISTYLKTLDSERRPENLNAVANALGDSRHRIERYAQIGPALDVVAQRWAENADRRPPPGRPRDSTKAKIITRVRKLREQEIPWSKIPDIVFKEFNRKHTEETLRDYLKKH